MKSFKPQLTTVENSVLEKINENLEFFVTNNLSVLAKNYFVGEATIIRMIKKLGFSSLKKMQFEYANKMNIEKISKIDKSDGKQTLKDIIHETSALSIYPILETIKDLNQKELNEIICQISAAKMIVIFSTGNSNYAAQYLYNSLFLIGKAIIKINSIDQFFELEEFQENKNLFIIIFSNSGLKKEVIKVFNECQTHAWKTL
jgi:DNA-binding MurR/RpiR family transcriptional regulator